jgi:hypothetical protein
MDEFLGRQQCSVEIRKWRKDDSVVNIWRSEQTISILYQHYTNIISTLYHISTMSTWLSDVPGVPYVNSLSATDPGRSLDAAKVQEVSHVTCFDMFWDIMKIRKDTCSYAGVLGMPKMVFVMVPSCNLHLDSTKLYG